MRKFVGAIILVTLAFTHTAWAGGNVKLSPKAEAELRQEIEMSNLSGSLSGVKSEIKKISEGMDEGLTVLSQKLSALGGSLRLQNDDITLIFWALGGVAALIILAYLLGRRDHRKSEERVIEVLGGGGGQAPTAAPSNPDAPPEGDDDPPPARQEPGGARTREFPFSIPGVSDDDLRGLIASMRSSGDGNHIQKHLTAALNSV